MKLFTTVTLLQLVDLILTNYYVHQLRVVIEHNPLLNSLDRLILAKFIFFLIYLAFYYFKGTEKQFKVVSIAIISLYSLATLGNILAIAYL